MISVFENSYNEALLLDSDWQFITNDHVVLETQAVLREVLKFNNIKSLEMYGHSSAIRGFQMDGDYDTSIRFDRRNDIEGFEIEGHDIDRPLKIGDLKSHFSSDAYALLYGCNSGWIMAKEFSDKWNIPVAGTFTEANFEILHSDGHFYIGDNTYAPNSSWAKYNPNLENHQSCDFGGCIRMRPRNHHYQGWWGNFDGPLVGHFKFFCPLDTQTCEKRMALSLYGFMAENPLSQNSDIDHFRKVLKEFLCPIDKGKVITQACYEELERLDNGNGDKFMSFINGNDQLVCNLKECQVKMECDIPNHNCVLTNFKSENSTTLADEYMHYIKGFNLIKAERK